MKPLLTASSALLLAGALFAAPALAQTMPQGNEDQPMASPGATTGWEPDVGQATGQPSGGQGMSQPSANQAASPQMSQSSLPQGSYLDTCKDARMLGGTLTAFCPKGDGTWHTVQLEQAGQCTGGVQVTGGELSCGNLPEVGSSAPPQGYGTYSSGAGTMTPPANGTYTPAYAPAPGETYAPPAYAPAPGQAYPSYPAYGAGTGWPYGNTPATSSQYQSPSATKAMQPPY
jgi:hypothetical protein